MVAVFENSKWGIGNLPKAHGRRRVAEHGFVTADDGVLRRGAACGASACKAAVCEAAARRAPSCKSRARRRTARAAVEAARVGERVR